MVSGNKHSISTNDVGSAEHEESTEHGLLKRSKSPLFHSRVTAFDRWLATRFGTAVVRLAMEGRYGRMVALQCEQIIDVGLKEALAFPKHVDLHGDTMLTARSLGICFGDS